MLAGHFSTALIAHQRFRSGTLLFFLIASQLQDLLWFAFHYLGLETTEPNDAFDATLKDMTVNMLFSHDLLPQFIWVGVTFLVGRFLFRDNKIALAGAALVIGHFILDFFSGHPHHVFGEESAHAGLGLYKTNVYLAIAIEAMFTVVALWIYFQNETRTRNPVGARQKASIIGLFVFGLTFMLTIATTSFREWLNIPELDLGFNTNVPTLILTYLGMILYLNYIIPQHQSSSTPLDTE